MKIEVERWSQICLLIFFALFLSLRILQEKSSYQTVVSSPQPKILLWVIDQPTSCFYRKYDFFLEIPDCQNLRRGEVYFVSGSLEGGSDRSKNRSKTLIISGITRVSCLDHLGICGLSLVLSYIYQFQDWSLAQAKNFVSPLILEVMLSMTFGGNFTSSDYYDQILQDTGTKHLASAGGYHLGVIAQFLTLAFSGLARQKRIIVIFLCSLTYTILTGLNPGILRAMAMLSYCLLSQWTFRQYDALRGWLFSFLLLGIINPWLILNIGFQLSFLASLCIIVYARLTKIRSSLFANSYLGQINLEPKSYKRIGLMAIVSELKSTAAISIVVQLGLWPLTAFYFHEVNFLSIPATSLVGFFVPAIIATCVLTIILASVSTIIWWPDLLFHFLSVPSAIFWQVAEKLAKAKSINWPVEEFQSYYWLWYVGLAIAIWIFWKKTRPHSIYE